jgi:2-succinyl-5-enolpyruvyl-6-hydroxy-3-cyclohexene-1-carboxylate synthase
METTMAGWHVSTAAEAIAAAQFARMGCDVSVQYGANQPEYDLMIARGDAMLKISVKGSSDFGWGLTQTQLAQWRKRNPDGPPNYIAAADMWLTRHKARTAMCFVNFRDVPQNAMPRIYLAWPKEVADKLKSARGGLGDTALKDLPISNVSYAAVSPDWVMTEARLKSLLEQKEASAELLRAAVAK